MRYWISRWNYGSLHWIIVYFINIHRQWPLKECVKRAIFTYCHQPQIKDFDSSFSPAFLFAIHLPWRMDDDHSAAPSMLVKLQNPHMLAPCPRWKYFFNNSWTTQQCAETYFVSPKLPRTTWWWKFQVTKRIWRLHIMTRWGNYTLPKVEELLF